YEAAREYFEDSLDIQRDIGDRAEVGTSLNNLGAVAGEQGEYEAAREYFEDASKVFSDLGAVRRALTALSSTSKAAENAGDQEGARQACDRALSLIEASDLNELTDRTREFQIRHARLTETPESTLNLYYHALGHVLENEARTAVALLRDVWDRRETHDPEDDIYSAVLAGGVGYAAYLTLVDTDEEFPDPEAVLSELEAHEERLETPEKELSQQLTGDEPDRTPDELRAEAADMEPESFGEQVQALKRQVYARLIELLSADSGAAVEDLDTGELYEQALCRAVAEDTEPQEVIGLLAAAWERRDDHDPGTADFDA
ncbi:MAG: tetratricopeptide repeat protein, partial [Halobaculum sp.]